MNKEIISKLKYGLIVSCQAEGDSPFNSPEGVTMFAKSAIAGGAVGIRSEGIEKTKMILNTLDVPVIGLIKSQFDDGSVRITGSFSDVDDLSFIGCPIIAVDGTFRKREGLTGPEFIRRIKSEFSAFIMADISKEDEAVECELAGADLISTTLNGYTPETMQDKIHSPNFELVKSLVSKIKKPLIAEGRINSPEAAKKIIELGVYAVVVGTAITRPQIITSWFVDAIKKMNELKTKYDVIVAGAGIAGISAAVKSAREGVSVLLIEHYGFVGGMSTAGMVSPFMKHSFNGETLVRGVFEDIEKEMRKRDGMIDNGFYASSFRDASFNLLQNADSNVLLHSEILKVNKIGNIIDSITVLINGIEYVIRAKVFIDTTGDAQLLYLGNFPYAKGDEKTGKLQALTLFFRMINIDIKTVTEYARANKDNFFDWMEYEFDFKKIISIAGYFKQVKNAISESRMQEDVQYIFFTTLPESGEGSFNTSNILGVDASTSYNLTQAELVGRKQVAQVAALLQNEIPGFENSILLETAVQVGVRETRRAIGDYAVTGDDIKFGHKFDDAIARAVYGIDIHGQKDEESRMEHLPEGQYYEIPVRALIVKEAENLLVAGRCISSTREGHSALRIQPTSSATGEACGALAALSVKQKKLVRKINYSDLQNLISHNLTKKV